MSDTVITRCPGCGTAFRVTREQLALREGQVRCGRCRAVFDANDHLVAGTARQPESVPAESTQAPAGATLSTEPAESAPAAEPRERPLATEPRETAPPPKVVEVAAPAEREATAHDEIDESTAAMDAGTSLAMSHDAAQPAPANRHDEVVASLDRARLHEWRPRKRLREQPRALYALATVALVVLLAGQALFEYLDALAAYAPFLQPLLEGACRVAGCSIAPLRDASALVIEASDLAADPAHRGLLELSATLRNRASYPIAYPHLELTLTDAADNVVARRAFPPATYAGGAVPASGISPNGEVLVRLFLDASATSQAGYRLYLFYP